jgi:HSP20 family molecular chaperone IbpA
MARAKGLPAEADESRMDASYRKGVLKTVMKTTKECESKKIGLKTD